MIDRDRHMHQLGTKQDEATHQVGNIRSGLPKSDHIICSRPATGSILRLVIDKAITPYFGSPQKSLLCKSPRSAVLCFGSDEGWIPVSKSTPSSHSAYSAQFFQPGLVDSIECCWKKSLRFCGRLPCEPHLLRLSTATRE